MSPRPVCPRCSAAGSPVPSTTLEHLLQPEAADALPAEGTWRFCATPSCPVVWYPEDPSGPLFTTEQVQVAVGLKEGSPPPHTVCYCFSHTIEEIEEDLRRRGRTEVVEDITRRVQAGECACEIRNPEGRCCLGRVRAAVREAEARLGVEPAAGPAPAASPPARERSRLPAWMTGGILGTALLASACCWLPLLLVALGLGAGSLGAFFGAARPWLAAATALLLGLAWYLAGRPAPAPQGETCCEQGGACDPALRRRRRRKILGLGVLALALLFLPSILTAVLDKGSPTPAEAGTEALLFRAQRGGDLPAAAAWFEGQDGVRQVVPLPGRAELRVDLEEALDPGEVRAAWSRELPVPGSLLPLRPYALHIEGMTCEACAAAVTSALLARPGVASARVDPESGAAEVLAAEEAEMPETLLQAVQEAGYEARPAGAPAPEDPGEETAMALFEVQGLAKTGSGAT